MRLESPDTVELAVRTISVNASVALSSIQDPGAGAANIVLRTKRVVAESVGAGRRSRWQAGHDVGRTSSRGRAARAG